MRMAIPYSRTLFGPLQWYSVLIVTGILLAIWLAGREERRLGLPRDTVIDLALIVVPCGIIGARLYYVAMTWDLFRNNPISILYIWEGGIAIYGAVIGAFIIGICENLLKGMKLTAFSDAFTFALLIVVLVVKPTGLFGEKATDKV